MAEDIGIVRRCLRCKRHLSIDRFREIGKLCSDCMDCAYRRNQNTDYVVRTRAIVLTDKGRAYLREMTEVASGKPAA